MNIEQLDREHFKGENVNHIVYDLYEETNIINKGREGRSGIQNQQEYIFNIEYVTHVGSFENIVCLAVLSSTSIWNMIFLFEFIILVTPDSWLKYRSIWLSSKSYMFASHINSVFCYWDDFIIFLQTILADVLQFELWSNPRAYDWP